MTNTASSKPDDATIAWPMWLANLTASPGWATRATQRSIVAPTNATAMCETPPARTPAGVTGAPWFAMQAPNAGVTCAARFAMSRWARVVAIAGVLAAGVVAAMLLPGSAQARTGSPPRIPAQNTVSGATALHALGSLATRGELTDVPATLAETGLYAEWATKTIAPDVLGFSPQYPLWSDGATKQRWIYLPSAIDAGDADAWVFPVGTRIWKQFSFGARVETRFMVLTAAGWKYATYLWRGEVAVRAPREGLAVAVARPEGSTSHRVPSEIDCRACHANAKTPVLGFAALQLSVDRDRNAPHRDLEIFELDPHRDGETSPRISRSPHVDLISLVIGGYVRGLDDIAPRIAGAPVQRAALGYLHGNCGGCHRAEGPLAGLGMVFAQPVHGGDVTLRGTAGVPSKFAPAPRIAPGDAEHSVVIARMQARRTLAQMPPIGTDVVDAEALRLVADWIDQLAPTKH